MRREMFVFVRTHYKSFFLMNDDIPPKINRTTVVYYFESSVLPSAPSVAPSKLKKLA